MKRITDEVMEKMNYDIENLTFADDWMLEASKKTQEAGLKKMRKALGHV